MKRLIAKIIKKGPLTDKELEVLRYLCEGYYRPEIALKMHRTISTISKHVEHIAEKLEATGSTEIVLIAEKLGLVEIEIRQDNPPSEFLLKTLLMYLIVIQIVMPYGRRPAQPIRPAVRLVRTVRQ